MGRNTIEFAYDEGRANKEEIEIAHSQAVNLILTGIAVIATIVGIGFGAAMTIQLARIRQTVIKETRSTARDEITKLKADLASNQRAFAEYLLAVQNIENGDAFECEVAAIQQRAAAYETKKRWWVPFTRSISRDEASQPDLWNAAVYAAKKRLWPVLNRANAYEGWNRDHTRVRTPVSAALTKITAARQTNAPCDTEELVLWAAVAYAILGESAATIQELSQVDNLPAHRWIYPYLDLFWDLPHETPADLDRMASLWEVAALRTSDEIAAEVTQRPLTDLWYPRYNLLGHFPATHHCALIGIVSRGEGDQHEWVVHWRTYGDEVQWPQKTTIAQSGRQTCQTLDEAAAWVSEQTTGIVIAPPELVERWDADSRKWQLESSEASRSLSNSFRGD